LRDLSVDRIFWRIDPLLGNDCETNNGTISVARQRPARQLTAWKVVFFARSAPMSAHATMDITVRSGVVYAIHAEGL
jgi:hypothetical protein